MYINYTQNVGSPLGGLEGDGVDGLVPDGSNADAAFLADSPIPAALAAVMK